MRRMTGIFSSSIRKIKTRLFGIRAIMVRNEPELLVQALMDCGSGLLVAVAVGAIIDENIVPVKAIIGTSLSLGLWYTGIALSRYNKENA